MEPQNLIDTILGVGFAVLGWFARELWAAVKELRGDLSKLREDLPKNYVVRDDYKNDLNEIKSMLSKIFDKLDNKQDK
jgi:hypothetical protein